MRGRKPHLISLSEADLMELERLIKVGKTEQRVARRARILLGMGRAQTRVADLANHLEITRAGIWELCRKYEERGIKAIYDAPRSGRPRVFSPLGQGPDRAACLL
ncbi:MAG: helix-turn-helix domain-containing protein [Candidatus Thorarchaeota archaeon]